MFADQRKAARRVERSRNQLSTPPDVLVVLALLTAVIVLTWSALSRGPGSVSRLVYAGVVGPRLLVSIAT